MTGYTYRYADHFGFLPHYDSDVLSRALASSLSREYQGQLAKFSFDGKMTAGRIDSKTAKLLIRRWAVLHRADLETNWQKMKAGQTLDRIAPLE
jgi:uncharacterized protein DUF4160